MIYFSGFSLQNEEQFFTPYLEPIAQSEYTVVGFSYGGIEAFEYVLNATHRVNRLILLSPAFFHNVPKEFAQQQLKVFEQNEAVYIKKFLKNVAYPSKIKLDTYLNKGTQKELEKLLKYKWNKEKLEKLIDKDIIIEVFLGEKDKIIDSKEALTFFKDTQATVYFLKGLGHLLQKD